MLLVPEKFDTVVENLANELNIKSDRPFIEERKYEDKCYRGFYLDEFLDIKKGYIELMENPEGEVYLQFSYYYVNTDQVFGLQPSKSLDKELKKHTSYLNKFTKFVEEFNGNYGGELERFQIVDTIDIYDYEDVRLKFNKALLTDTVVLAKEILALIEVLKLNWGLSK